MTRAQTKARGGGRMAMTALVVVATLATTAPAGAGRAGVEHLLREDFGSGFAPAPAGPWSLFRYDGRLGGSYIADDGVTATSASEGLSVRAAGSNPTTGDPAFTRTMAQEDDNAFGLPGQLDHFKWLAVSSRTAASGWPGYEAPAGRELVTAWSVAGQAFGTAGHPFGAAVPDPDDDLRLGALTTLAFDVETQLGFGFLLTDRRIYAWYERRPFARDRLGHYAAFAFAVPIADRRSGPWADLAVAYDRAGGTVRWLDGNRERLRLSNPGQLIDRRWMVLDHGGTPGIVTPRQLAPGFGMLTFLDGALGGGSALVRLSNLPYHYFDIVRGEPSPQLFVDNSSSDGSRLFGQGAELRIRRVEVDSRHARP